MVFWHAMIGLCNFRHFYITAGDVRKQQRCEITKGPLGYPSRGALPDPAVQRKTALTVSM